MDLCCCGKHLYNCSTNTVTCRWHKMHFNVMKWENLNHSHCCIQMFEQLFFFIPPELKFQGNLFDQNLFVWRCGRCFQELSIIASSQETFGQFQTKLTRSIRLGSQRLRVCWDYNFRIHFCKRIYAENPKDLSLNSNIDMQSLSGCAVLSLINLQTPWVVQGIQ